MKPIIIEDNIFDFEPCEEDGSVLLAEETPWRGFADELQDLHYLKGVQFINQLKLIVNCGEFRPIAGETNIFSAIGEESSDYENLINAARKAVDHGYRVYILPNPKGSLIKIRKILNFSFLRIFLFTQCTTFAPPNKAH